MVSRLEEADAGPPVVFSRLWVDDNLVGEGVGIGSGDGRNVVFVAVDDGDDLVRGFFQRLCHCATDLEDVSLGPGLGESHVKRPLLPANVFVCLSEKVRLSPLLLEELDDNLTSSAWLVGAVYGAHKRKRLLLNKGFKVDIIDGGQRQVEQVACQGRYRGKVPVKEDGMQDCLDDILDKGSICEDVEVVLWPPSLFHGGSSKVLGARAGDRERGRAPHGVWLGASRRGKGANGGRDSRRGCEADGDGGSSRSRNRSSSEGVWGRAAASRESRVVEWQRAWLGQVWR